MSGRFSDLFVGWVFVVCAGAVLAGLITSVISGESRGWYVPLVLVALAALFLLIGIAVLLRDVPRWMLLLVVGGCAMAFIGVGAAAMLVPEQMTVTTGRGPRTPGAARVAGLVTTLAGLMGIAAALLRRRRTSRLPH